MLYNRRSTAARSVICVSRRFSVIDRSVIRHIVICSSIVSLTSGCMSLNRSRAVIRELSLGISRPSVFIDDADVGRRIRAAEFRISRTVTRSLLCRTSKFFAGSTTSGRLDGNGRIICCEIAAVGAYRCSCRCRAFFGDGLVGSRLHRRPNGAFTESTSAIHNSLGLSRAAIGNAVFTSRLSNGRSYAAVSRGFHFDMSRRSCILSLRYITTLSGRSNNDCITFSSRAVATSRDFALALRLRTRSWFSGYILCLSARSDSSFTARSGRFSGQCTSIAEYRCGCLRCCSTGSTTTTDRCIALVYQRRCGILNGCVCRRAICDRCARRCRCRFNRTRAISNSLCYGIGIHNARFRTFAVAMVAKEHRCNTSPERSGFRFWFIHCGHGRMCGLESLRCHANRIADLGTSNFLSGIIVSQRVVCNLAIFVGCGCISFLSGCITINHGRVTGIASNVFRGTSAFSSTLRQLSRCNNLGSFFVCQAALRVRYHVSIGNVAIADRNSQSTIRHIVTAHGHVNTGDFRTFSKLLCQLRVSVCKRILHCGQRFRRIVINSRIRVAHFCGTLLVGHLEPTGIVSFGSIKLLLCFSLFGISGNSSRLFLVVFAKRRIGNTSKVIQILAFHCRPCGNCSRAICAILVQLTSGNAERCRILCIWDNVAKASPLPVRHASSGPFLRAICRSASGVFKTELTFIRSKDCTLPIRTDSQVGSLGCNRARFITGITESGNACNFAILIAVSNLTIDSAFNGVIGSQVFNRTLRHLATIKPKLIQSVCHSLTIRIGIKGYTRVIIHVATLSVCTTYKAVGLFFVTKADLAVFVQIACSSSCCAIGTCSCCHACSNWLVITARAAYNISNGISSCTAVASNAACQTKSIMRGTRNNSESANRFTHRVKTCCACDAESGFCKHIVQLLCDFEVCVCDKAPFHDAFNRCADQSDVQCRSCNTNDPNVQN